ncbi:MAG TPA: hypothetical protein VLE89_00660 [Chlamydiales bacterium]|nr:hypothetical protein [Chlamydiales bacterium]
MRFQNSLLFHPEWIIWVGFSILGGLLLFICPFLVHLCKNHVPFVDAKIGQSGEKKVAPLTFSLGLDPSSFSFPVPDLQEEVTFSFDPPRPESALHNPQLLVRLKKSVQSKRISLPCRLDFRYVQEKLTFSEGESDFWLELNSAPEGQIEGKICIHCPMQGKTEMGNFQVIVQESPILSSVEFPEGSPFRLLAEARWWGHDLFSEKYGEKESPSERLEIGNGATADLIDMKEGEWLVWQEGHWKKVSSMAEGKNKPIAHIQSISQTLLLEGWGTDHHTRLCLYPAAGTPLKIRGEDLFGSIRIRSEKQISCTLEKQCLILKIGDWVLKRDGRWKILRKKEERNAFLHGELVGELFVLEGIELKQGQKIIQGHFFNTGRSQMVQIEMPAHTMRKAGKEAGENTGRRGRLR